MNNKIFKMNFSGISGLILLIIFIALGFLALTFFAVFIGVIVLLVIASFIIRKLFSFTGIKKEPSRPAAEYYRGKIIENAEYEVQDDDEQHKVIEQPKTEDIKKESVKPD